MLSIPRVLLSSGDARQTQLARSMTAHEPTRLDFFPRGSDRLANIHGELTARMEVAAAGRRRGIRHLTLEDDAFTPRRLAGDRSSASRPRPRIRLRNC